MLLYGSDCWKTTVAIERKLEVFQNKCLSRFLKIFRPNTISNGDLGSRAESVTMHDTIQMHRWRWLDMFCVFLIRFPEQLRCTPQGKRYCWLPKETCRTIEKELKGIGLTLETDPSTAADRVKWRSLCQTPQRG